MAYTTPASNDIEFVFTQGGYDSSGDIILDLAAEQGAPTNIFRILAGTSSMFTAVWADLTANIQNAKLYVASAGTGAAFSVVNLATQALVDSYTINTSGVDDKLLDGTDIVDINVEG